MSVVLFDWAFLCFRKGEGDGMGGKKGEEFA